MYLLDTNVVSELRKNKPHGAVRAWIDAATESSLFLSAVTIGEIQAGVESTRERDPAKADEIERWLELLAVAYNVLPMDAAAFREWGRLTHRKSDTLPEDAMIAATARLHGLVVVTRNVADFETLGVETLDPFKSRRAKAIEPSRRDCQPKPRQRVAARRAALVVFGAFVVGAASIGLPARAADASATASLAATYKSRADQLIGAALVDDEGYANLAYLCDRIGHRVSGSEALTRAVDWAAALMRRQGLANVSLQPVKVPKWVRGQESASIVAPVTRPLHMLGLGMSVGTPAGGITAEVLVVSSLEQLERTDRAQVKGKIVVFDVPYESYGRSVRVRYAGPTQAAAKGAVGALVRSITPLAMQTPHTGTTGVNETGPNIPAAAITPEDAALLSRLVAAGNGTPVRVHLAMQAQRAPDDAPSANVIGEIVGREKPDEVVVLGGHIDSWDVGQGAQDDGSGIMAALSAVRLIHQLGLKPRRTIRVVFWTNEENGGAGGKAYRAALSDAALANHVAAIEMDGGAEAPVGYAYGRSKAGQPVLAEEQRSFELLRDIAALLKPVGASTIAPGGHGADIEPLMNDGVPGLGETTTMAHYFDWHHTEADTLDKVDPVEFRKNVASLAVLAFVLADMPERLAGRRGD